VKLNNGDTLLLYTDGVPDALNSRQEEYGMSRLMDVASASGSLLPDKLLAHSLSDLQVFREGTARFDDITMMGIRREHS
jgi:phosphoserine phosphatase RsbU/P